MTIPELLRSSKTIAIVGISDRPGRPADEVPKELLRRGFTIIPVNPTLKEWNGIPAYPDVASIPENITIDIVDVFRKSEVTPDVVRDVLKRNNKPRCIWLQLGIKNEEAQKLTEQAGIFYVENHCIGVETALLNVMVA
jgi:predicted CoA-binding protein